MNAAKTKLNVYEIVTDRILAALDKGVVPWQKPWKTNAPMNLVSKKAYRGVNIWLLGISAMDAGYTSPYWVSYKQAQSLGGTVKKGEKSTVVTFWKVVGKEESKTDKAYRILRYFRVFNVEQCEGFESKIPVIPDAADFSVDESAESILAGYKNPPDVSHGGDRAAYSPSLDHVYMPKRETFVGSPEYYSTHFHEFAHSTGHDSRLSRKGITEPIRFGADPYAEEELIAELTASFLCAQAGILEYIIDNTAAYIEGWRKKISSDPKLVVKAAGAAQKAADHILGVSWDKAETDTESEVESV